MSGSCREAPEAGAAGGNTGVKRGVGVGHTGWHSRAGLDRAHFCALNSPRLPLSILLQFFFPLVSLHIHSFQNYTTCIFMSLPHSFWKIIFSVYIHYPGLSGLHS